ncbi:MAG: sulfite exporter TauE/SafE family protein [Sphingomonadaceae bacterium]|nr:sulfite exporter TauE/SafE family protein [Sphingomonadaceae bacterium]
MDFFVVGMVAFLASGLTLYSGFGLGTVLLPAFALFFPIEVAVAATGTVHLLNNLFKGSLLGRRADWRIVALFGLPAVPAAVAGAWLLGELGGTPRLFTWGAFGWEFGPTAAGITIGALMILFALLEVQPWFQRLAAPPRLIPLGGIVTGFFGGLTGQQGAFRSMFLLKSGLDPTRFIATGVVTAVLVDLARLPTYAASFRGNVGLGGHGWALVGVGTLCAFVGAFLGVRYLKKATIGVVRAMVAGLMLLIGAALVTGLLG